MSRKLDYARREPNRLDAYTQGPIGPALLRMAMHMSVGFLAMSIFNITDTFFVSKLGTVSLAAMSFTFPIVFMVFSIVFGIGIATAAVVSRSVGAGDPHRLQRLTTDAMLLTFVVATALTALGLNFLHPLLAAMGAEGETLALSSQYMRLWFWAFPLASLPMVGNNAIRASGDTRTPAIIMSLSAVLNLVLDPVFIFGLGPIPKMGILGAAAATIISRYVSVLAAMWILTRRLKLITLERTSPAAIWGSWKPLLQTAGPAAATQVFMPISMYVITAMVKRLGGNVSVAAMGAATRFEGLTLIPVMALSTVLLPFIGQNYGRGNLDRILHTLRLSRRFMLGWGVLVVVAMLPASPLVSRLFSSDPEVLTQLRWMLVILCVSHGVVGLGMSAGHGLNATGRPLLAAVVTVARTVGLSVPLGWLLGMKFGPMGVIAGLSGGRLIAGIAAERWLTHLVRRSRRVAEVKEAVVEEEEDPVVAGEA